ncbi:MAG: PilW family protein [Planctomycetota bacterium]|jgi:type II secretory pathway pseudopilin PulG
MAFGKMRKGFTLMELVVAIGLLMMIFGFTAIVFKVSAESHRQARAGSEVMVKLRAVTDQLNRDFKCLRKDAPLFIRFKQVPADLNFPDGPQHRLDQIIFFAIGDYQSTQVYDSISGVPDPAGNKLLRGNTARIYYGHAQSFDRQTGNVEPPYILSDPNERMLARNQHILMTDTFGGSNAWPDIANSDVNTDIKLFDGDYSRNEIYEHDSMSLAHWLAQGKETFEAVTDFCFGNPLTVDIYDPNTYHNLLCEGVKSFAVQWAYWDTVSGRLRWFPDDDPDGDGLYSHFADTMGTDIFGIYFNVPQLEAENWYRIDDGNVPGVVKPSGDYPVALKFTFVICDSKGIVTRPDKLGNEKKGREFTHIIYLKD